MSTKPTLPPGTEPFPHKFVGEPEDWTFMGDSMQAGESVILKPNEVPRYDQPLPTQDRKAQPKHK